MPTEEQLKELRRLEQELDITPSLRIDESVMYKLTEPQPKAPDKPILILDFDGVLHSYISGWQGADTANDDPVDGAVDFCNQAIKKFNIWVVSSRCGQPGGSQCILRWLEKWHFPMGMLVSDNGSKPAAFLTLDDRAMTFDGHWPDIDLMLNFKPWYKK